MHIIKLNLFLLFLCFALSIEAQSTISRITFPIDESQTATILAKAGIDLSHGHGKPGSFFTTEAHDFELTRFDALGIRYTIDVPDLATYRRNEAHSSRGGLLDCQDDVNDSPIPQNFELGSVGGYFSLSEMLDQLDVMAFLYPNLISVRKPIGNFKTWKNNNIFWVRISDNPEVDEDEPELLYTSLIHAREFISLSQNIFYMWYLLENYNKNPEIKQILDHTELYFVPVVNPDGLNYNVQGYDATEKVFNHFQRKNLRDNDGDGTFDPENDGVDLNRNFGNHWGYDDEGSSPYEGASTYRGPSAFSEPETKAIQFFCNTHDFKFALNYHSYGNLLIYPWGYSNEHTPDSIAFVSFGQLLSNLNRFVYGLGMETVGYVTNGDSDDWMYDALNIISMTPEVGGSDDDFYPLRDRIIPLCKSTLQMNILAARLVNSLIVVTDESPSFIQAGLNPLRLEFSRYGLLDGEVAITFKPITSNVLQVPEAITFDLNKFETHTRNLSFTVEDDIPYGSTAAIEVSCRQDQYTFIDTIVKVRADFDILIEDDGDLTHWDITNGQEWGTTNAAYKSGPISITDSPDGMYGPNINEVIVLKETIDLTETTSAYAQFWARWEIEDEYDYVVFQASTDGENWENLCGERSKLGGVFQLYEEPLYDGKQTQWVLENVDLSTFLGHQLQLRFQIASDGYVFKDGFYFDDFKVITIKEETVAAEEIDETEISVYPNPAADFIKIETSSQNTSISIYNSLGIEVFSGKTADHPSIQISTREWIEGIYHYVIFSEGKNVLTGNICILK